MQIPQPKIIELFFDFGVFSQIAKFLLFGIIKIKKIA